MKALIHHGKRQSKKPWKDTSGYLNPPFPCRKNEILGALNYEIDVPCVVQWGLLWFSSLSRLNQRFGDGGTKIAMYHDVINLPIVATFTAPFGGFNTPRTCMRSVAAVLDRAPEKDWDVGRQGDDWLGTR